MSRRSDSRLCNNKLAVARRDEYRGGGVKEHSVPLATSPGVEVAARLPSTPLLVKPLRAFPALERAAGPPGETTFS